MHSAALPSLSRQQLFPGSAISGTALNQISHCKKNGEQPKSHSPFPASRFFPRLRRETDFVLLASVRAQHPEGASAVGPDQHKSILAIRDASEFALHVCRSLDLVAIDLYDHIATGQ